MLLDCEQRGGSDPASANRVWLSSHLRRAVAGELATSSSLVLARPIKVV